MNRCKVSYRDQKGIEQAVEVTAESLYEAAALGFDSFASGELTEGRPGADTIVEITVQPHPVTHRVRVSQLRVRTERD